MNADLAGHCVVIVAKRKPATVQGLPGQGKVTPAIGKAVLLDNSGVAFITPMQQSL